MKRVFLVSLLLLFLLASCNLADLQIGDIQDSSDAGNSFEIADPVAPLASFTLLLTSDQHFHRTNSGVYYKEAIFHTWIDAYKSSHDAYVEKRIDRMICLGDITENSDPKEFKLYKEFTENLRTKGITTYTVKGNHDIRPGTNHIADWKTYVGSSFQAFSYNGVSFYLLNSANRTLGRVQMKKLRAAVENDSHPKIFVSHVPLYGAPFLIYLTFSDSQERESIIHLMVQNRGALFLAGHHHQGDVLYSFRKTTSEFILGAFHGRDSLFEKTKPRWYLLYFSNEEKTLTITRYQVEEDGTIHIVLNRYAVARALSLHQ